MFLLSFLSLANAQCPTGETIQAALTCSSNYYGVVDHTEASQLGGDCNDTTGTYECYSCGDPYAEERQIAPEAVYTFFCQNSGNVVMQIEDLPCDLDIYVLDDTCDPYDGCVQGSTQPYNVSDSVQFECTQGELYYIVVEAYGTAHFQTQTVSDPCTDDGTISGNVYSPSYTLSFDVSASTGCAEDCDDGEDNDLDGTIDCADDDCWSEALCCDLDGDGVFSEDCLGTDCDDNDPTVYENAPEDGGTGTGEPDGKDNDCDGTIDEGTNVSGSDNDGDGFTEADGDCNDNDPNINPNAEEILGNGIDDNCNGQIDEDSSPIEPEPSAEGQELVEETKEEQGCNCQQTSLQGRDILTLALLGAVISFRRRE